MTLNSIKTILIYLEILKKIHYIIKKENIMAELKSKKIFKEKKSIKTELANALENGIKLNFSLLAKSVGISVHRVKKYCKNHNINLDDYNLETINNKKVKQDFDLAMKKSKKKKVQVEPNTNKIQIGLPKNIKVSIKDKNDDS